MSQKRIKTKFSGVYYRESTNKRYRGNPDKCFVIWIRENGKDKWKTIGWSSDGITAQFANAKRTDLIASLKIQTPLKGSINPDLTLNDAVDMLIKWKELEGKNTKRETDRYGLHLKPRLGSLPLESLTAHILLETRNILAQTLSDSSIQKCFAFVRSAVNHALEEERWQGRNPFSTTGSKFKLITPDNSALRFLTTDEAKLLLTALSKRSMQLHDMSLVSLRTGLRSTEIFSLRGDSIELESGTLRFRSKLGPIERVQAPESILRLLQDYGRTPDEFIFQSKSGEAITAGISSTFERTAKALGLNKRNTDPKLRVRFHTFRHTFASWLAQSGEVTLHELKELMRHKRIETTLRYAHLIPDEQRKKLSIIGRLMD